MATKGGGVLSGALLGACYGATGAFTASLMDEPARLERHITLTFASFVLLAVCFYVLLRRAEAARPVALPALDVREMLAKHDEGRGAWRQLSHVRQEAAGWRVDLHDLEHVEAVVDDLAAIAERHHLRLVVGDGTARSADPRLRRRVEERLRLRIEPTRLRHGRRTLSTLPTVAMQHGGNLRLPTLLMTLSIVFVGLLLV